MTERATGRPVSRRGAAPRPAGRAPAADPDAWVLDGLLADGRPVRIRPAARVDRAWVAGLAGSGHGLGSLLARLGGRSPVGGPGRMAFVAVRGDVGVGVAAYEPVDEPSSAELGLVVDGSVAAAGTGPLLLEAVAAHARQAGIHRFTAHGLRAGSALLALLRDSGLSLTEHRRRDGTAVEVDLTPSERYRARCDVRESLAEAASIAHVLRPSTVAVVGAGRRPGAVGHEVVRSLLQADFVGAVFPVNPGAGAVAGVPAYPSIGQVPGPVDLAVVAVPPALVLGVVEEAAAAGVRAAVIVTSGFAELGADGADIERAIGELARHAGMRLVGPNCLGVYNADPSVHLQATFALAPPHRGRIALGSQSGAVGIVLSERARPRRDGHLELRLAGQQARRQRQRPALFLGARPADRGHRPLPRVDRQPAQVLAHRPEGGPGEADRGVEGREVHGRGPGGALAHGRRRHPRGGGAGHVGGVRRRGGRHPRRAAGRLGAAGHRAAARRAPGGPRAAIPGGP